MTTQMFILGNSFIWSIEGCMTYNPKSLSMLISKCFDHYFQFMLRFYIQG